MRLLVSWRRADRNLGQALVRLPDGAGVRLLSKAIMSAPARERLAAVRTAAALEDEPPELLPALSYCARYARGRLRREALDVIAGRGDGTAAMLRWLRPLLKSRDRATARAAALTVLSVQAPVRGRSVVAAVLDALFSLPVTQRLQYVEYYPRLVSRATSSASLGTLLGQAGPAWHYDAALCAVLPAASESPALQRLLVSLEAAPVGGHQLMAAASLLGIDTSHAARRHRVLTGLSRARGGVLDRALLALDHFPGAAAVCEGALVRLLRSRRPTVVVAASSLLMRLRAGARHEAALLQVLRRGLYLGSAWAAAALTWGDRYAGEAMEWLCASATGGDYAQAWACVRALREVRTWDAATRAMITALEHHPAASVAREASLVLRARCASSLEPSSESARGRAGAGATTSPS